MSQTSESESCPGARLKLCWCLLALAATGTLVAAADLRQLAAVQTGTRPASGGPSTDGSCSNRTDLESEIELGDRKVADTANDVHLARRSRSPAKSESGHQNDAGQLRPARWRRQTGDQMGASQPPEQDHHQSKFSRSVSVALGKQCLGARRWNCASFASARRKLGQILADRNRSAPSFCQRASWPYHSPPLSSA